MIRTEIIVALPELGDLSYVIEHCNNDKELEISYFLNPKKSWPSVRIGQLSLDGRWGRPTFETLHTQLDFGDTAELEVYQTIIKNAIKFCRYLDERTGEPVDEKISDAEVIKQGTIR